ncbi:uncharacterized protein LOC141630919 [Silene latifolia]|uniref:uncharacterized protein LOC141630919 n=1 Tax=Silene latifolia TaxID=37657 RepID=UPI003D7747AC
MTDIVATIKVEEARQARYSGFRNYWPTLRADCLDYYAICEACQIHALIIHQPSELLNLICTSWPFMKSGMDIVGKFPVAPGQKVFMLAMTDYFSKSIEADSLRQFVGKRTKAFCDEWNINLVTSTPGYPKANGQAESCNKVVISCLKKKQKIKRGRWAEELPLVIWANRATPKTSTDQTPYSLVYRSEAVIPAEVHVPT